MANCGCGVVKASGDPAGRSISSLQGLRGAKKSSRKSKKLTCKYEKRKGKRTWTCRDASGKKVAKPKKRRR